MSVTRYTKDHEWIRVDALEAGAEATIGITDYAQGQLGDIVFVELPEPGKVLTQGGDAAVVESVKAASEVYAPIDGEVTDVNGALVDEPAKVNTDPTGEGWFLKMTVSDPAQLEGLMDETAYQAYLEGLA